MIESADASRVLHDALLRAESPPEIVSDPEEILTFLPLDYGMALGIESTRGGRLWACSIGGGDDHNAFLVARWSDDQGEEWSRPKLLVNPGDRDFPLRKRSLVGAFWCAPDGGLWLFVDQAVTYFDGRAGTWVLHCSDPDGPAPTWSAPRRIADGCVLNKPIVLADGTWVVAGSLWDRTRIESPNRGRRETWPENPFSDSFHALDRDRGIFVLTSTDRGASWLPTGRIHLPNPEFDEPRLVERQDGSLWLTARAAVGGLWEAVSNDGGSTWSEPAPSVIRHPSSRHLIMRLASGRLLLVKHGMTPDAVPADGARTDLCAFLSDDGVAWSEPLLLDDRIKVSYPDATQLPDGTICVTYDLNRNTQGQVLMARFIEADVLNGGGTASLRLLVSEPDGDAMRIRIQRDQRSGFWAPNRDGAAV